MLVQLGLCQTSPVRKPQCWFSYDVACPILHRLGMESEETTSTEINNPGAYSTVCVELDVASLAVNTIIEVSLTIGSDSFTSFRKGHIVIGQYFCFLMTS